MITCEVCNTVYARTGGPEPVEKLAHYLPDGRVRLVKTGHTVDKAALGEGLGFYYGRVAAQVGGDPNHAGALLLMGDTYAVGNTDDPILDIAVHVDAFANPTPYGLGEPGQPGVAGIPGVKPGTGGPDPIGPVTGGDNLYLGTILANGENTAWTPCNPRQVCYVLVEQDGLYSAVCDGSVPTYGGVGFPPGVATFADLLAGGSWGAGTTGDVFVKAGQHFCFAHDGVRDNRLRCSGK